MGTGKRTEILIHPANGFLSSEGCLNTASVLKNSSSNMDFVDSRDRTIALISDLRNFLGSKFPNSNGKVIPNAHAIVRLKDSNVRTEDKNGKLTMQGTKALKPLLELIGEVESKNNYNAYYRKPNNKNNPRLDAMTINQVLNWQDSYIASGSKSSAAGYYQIIRKTLRHLLNKMNIPSSTIFSAQLQDEMAVHLMKERGLDEFLAGNLALSSFANELAKIWASLPVVNGENKGKSYYAGDGLNKALVSVSAIVSKLEEVRPI